MTTPNSVELEAAKFLHKLIQESTDEPTKLATKLYVILQHMRSSGKENSMPYQVISRAMETVINQHNLDIEALMSSRLTLTGGTQVGDSASSQFSGSSQRLAVARDSNTNLAENEMAKVDAYASNRPPIGPSSAGHDIYHGSVSHLNSKPFDYESPSSFDTRSTNSQSQERHHSPNLEKANEKNRKKGCSKRKRAESSLAAETHIAKLQSLDTRNHNPSTNTVDLPRSFSVQGGEHSHFNMVQCSSQMEHSPSITSSMRSMFRVKQESQHQTEKSLDSTNVSNLLSQATNSNLPEEIGVSSALPSTHDVVSSSGLWNEIGLPLDKPQVSRFSFHGAGGHSSAEILMHQSSASSLGSGAASKFHGATPGALGSYATLELGIPSPMQFCSSYDNPGLVAKMHKDRSMEAFSATPSSELSAGKGTVVRVLEHEGGISNTLPNANKTVQGGIPNNVTEMTMLRSATSRDAGKSPLSLAPAVSGMPFKEQHLKQLRAQCLVFLAFRNGSMPKKLHLEIALGNFFPKEDGSYKELIDHKGKEQSIDDPSSIPEITIPFGRLDNARETVSISRGPSSTGTFTEPNLLKEAENPTIMEEKCGPPSGLSEHAEERRHLLLTRKNPEAEMQTQDTAKSQTSATKGPQHDSLSASGLAVGNNMGDLENRHRQVGMTDQAFSVFGIGQQMKPEVIGWTGNGCHNEASKLLLPLSGVLPEPVPERKDNAPSQSQSLGECYIHGNRRDEGHLPNFSSREHLKPLSGMGVEHHLVMSGKDANVLAKNVSLVLETDQEVEDILASTGMPTSPKYTTSVKWIMDQQKRKLLAEKNWALKQQKTDQRITSCSDKLKETVSSSEDISAKTRSVIELKKLQLLELQRHLRSDILNDFFKPIATEMDRLKSIKKHRIGRRSKQLEKFEQKMKEERQKRIRERQKEFFSEIEVHKERLEDVFKMRRERCKGFSKYVREFHKRKERFLREKIDRIQREKINLLKINDVEGYLRMVQDAKSDRVKQLLKETEKYLQKLGSKLQDAKAMSRCFETDMDENRTAGFVDNNEVAIENEDETDQAKHYMESNEKYYLMAHSIKENIAEQPTCLEGGKLREYQMNGLRWLVSLYNNHLNGILADEMGLGKTVQVIALMCYLMETKNDRGPFLVVVPSSVLPGWESEINFWAPSINKIVYSGPPEERRKLFKERIVQHKFNVLLTTYEYLMNKHDRPKLSKIQWHYVIIDEGHRIKNASCKLNADLKQYHSSHRLLLTGTPLQNNLEELWALLNFLLPNIFNSSVDFSQWFNKPFESNGDNSPDEALLSEEENLLIINRLHQVLRPFVLRRLKHKVEHQLPEKIERLVRCEASGYQKLLMKRVEENLGAIGTSKVRSVHNSVIELRNICNHPYLSQLHVEEVHDFIPKHYLPNIVRLCGKLEMLDRLLPKLKATDHRVLFFSTMTRLLDVMEDYLCWKQYRYVRLDGHTSGGERGALIDQFNQPGSPFFIFLLSIRAGGVGVNLQAADTVIIFDTDWNPQVDLQAQARAHRIGQKRDVLVLRLETVQTVEEQVRAAAEHKLGVANQSITAGFFDNNTSAEDRREYLESLLRECKKEEAAPVLHDDALNDLIARSEAEIDIFESIDKKRREEEMAAWKKLVSGQGTDGIEPVTPLPSRLLTDVELKPFCEAMKIFEVPNPVVLPNFGVKRKGEELGGLDTQHYGRGKRAREVRSYEEQWTEDEFEKICQADSPESPKLKEEMIEHNLPMVIGESIKVIGETEAMAPPKQPPQPSVQSKEVTPPSKRGRGRPRKATAEISPSPMALPAPSEAGKMDMGIQKGTVSNCPAAPGPDYLPSSTAVKSSSGTFHQFGVLIAPSCQSNPSLPSVSPGSQSATPPCASIPMPVKVRGQKTQSGGEAPRRRGRKKSSVSPAVPVLPAPSGTDQPDMGSQGGMVSSVPTAPGPDLASGSITLKDVGTKSKSLSPVVPVPLASSGDTTLNMGSQRGPVSSSPILPGSSILTVVSGTMHDLGVGVAPLSQPTPTLSSVALGSESIPPLHSVPKQVKRRGRKPQSGVEVPRRRGKKQDAVTTVVPDVLGGQEPISNEPLLQKSRVPVERKIIATRSKRASEAQKLPNVIQAQAFKVHNPDGFASQDSTITEQSDYSAQNKQETSSSATIDVAARSPDKKSTDLKLNEVDASAVSKDRILSTEIEARCADPAKGQIRHADVKDVPPVIKEILCDNPLSATKVDDSSRSGGGGDAQTLPASRETLIEVTASQTLDDKTYSAFSTLETALVGDLPIEKSKSESRNDGGEKGEEGINLVPDDSVAPKSKVHEESERTSVSITSIANPEQLIDESFRSNGDDALDGPMSSEALLTLGTVAEVLDLSVDRSENEFCTADAEGQENKGPVLEEIVVPNPEVNQISEENTVPPFSTLNRALDLPVDESENQSGNELTEEQESEDPVLDEAFISEPHLTVSGSLKENSFSTLEAAVPALELPMDQSENSTRREDMKQEESKYPALANSVSTSKPEVTEDSSEEKALLTSERAAPGIEPALDMSEDQSGKADTNEEENRDPVLVEALFSKIGVAEDSSLKEKTFSTSSIFEMAAPVIEPQTEKSANQSEKELEAKGQESKDSDQNEAVLSKPIICESETKPTACSSQKSFMTLSTLEAAEVPALELPMDKSENPDRGDDVKKQESKDPVGDNVKKQESKDPVLADSLISKSEVTQNSSEVAAPVVEFALKESEDQSRKRDKDEQESRDPVLDETLVSKPGVAEDQSLEEKTYSTSSNVETEYPIVEPQTESCGNQCEKEVEAGQESKEVAEDQSLEEKTYSTSPNVETESPIVESQTEIFGNQSEKEVEAGQESKDSNLDEVVLSKPEVCEPETKPIAGSSANIADSVKLIEEDPDVGINKVVPSAAPLNAVPKDDVAGEKPPVLDTSIDSSCIGASSIQDGSTLGSEGVECHGATDD